MTNSYSTQGQPTLGQILDVDINPATLANNNVIKYNSTTGLWDNAVIPAGATTSGLDTVLTNGNTTTQTATFQDAFQNNTISHTGMSNSLSITLTSNLGYVVVGNDGNLGLNTTDFGSAPRSVISFEEDTGPTVPNPTGGILYVRAGALRYLGSGGTTTIIAPA